MLNSTLQIPGLITKAVVSKTIAKVVHTTTGRTTEAANLANMRTKICQACPIYVNGVCSKQKGGCGCKIALKVYSKTCPLKKW